MSLELCIHYNKEKKYCKRDHRIQDDWCKRYTSINDTRLNRCHQNITEAETERIESKSW